jgi:hypothetical protein
MKPLAFADSTFDQVYGFLSFGKLNGSSTKYPVEKPRFIDTFGRGPNVKRTPYSKAVSTSPPIALNLLGVVKLFDPI